MSETVDLSLLGLSDVIYYDAAFSSERMVFILYWYGWIGMDF